MKKLFIVAAIVLATMLSVLAQTRSGYHISQTFPIKSTGGYDYITVDSMSEKLYVSHGTQVNIINKNTGDSISYIPTGKDVHGIALVHSLGKGYITNGSANSVLVFDLKTNKVLAHIPAGEFADGILYDDYSNKIISCNGKTKNLTVIDPVNDKVVTTIQLTGWPETATSDGKGRIYVNNAEKSEIDVIDAKSFKIIANWSVAPAKGPSGLTIDRATMRLFAGCDNKLLAIIDARSGKLIKTLPIGDGCDAVGFDVKWKTIYSSNGESGTITIIKELGNGKFSFENIKTEIGARTLAVDQKTHKLYLPTAKFKPATKESFRPPVVPGTFKVLVVSK